MFNYFLFISFLSIFPLRGSTLFHETSPELREILNLNTGWQYLGKDVPFSDLGVLPLSWEIIDLPHTWNAFDATDEVPGYRRAASWYRKNLTLPDYDSPKAYLLYFEGANLVTDVYVNNKHVGTHIGGYVGFEMDISAFLSKGPNLLGIRVDNSVNRDIIPSQKSDFFIYGGIVRDLWLKVLPKNHIKLVHVKTPEVSERQAETIIEAFFPKDLQGAWELDVRINDPDGKVLSRQSKHFQSLNLAQSIQVEMPVVSNPKLWSPDHPHILAHYPQDPEVYKACDEPGLLVWDEVSWWRWRRSVETKCYETFRSPNNPKFQPPQHHFALRHGPASNRLRNLHRQQHP